MFDRVNFNNRVKFAKEHAIVTMNIIKIFCLSDNHLQNYLGHSSRFAWLLTEKLRKFIFVKQNDFMNCELSEQLKLLPWKIVQYRLKLGKIIFCGYQLLLTTIKVLLFKSDVMHPYRQIHLKLGFSPLSTTYFICNNYLRLTMNYHYYET